VPEDLQRALDKNKTALKNFEAFPKSSKKIILEWISNAKKPETRLQRIKETVEKAAQNIRAKITTDHKLTYSMKTAIPIIRLTIAASAIIIILSINGCMSAERLYASGKKEMDAKDLKKAEKKFTKILSERLFVCTCHLWFGQYRPDQW
jgi:hypothetical protein